MENWNYHLNKSFFRDPLVYDDLRVVQVGRLYCKSTTVIDTHMHLDCYELTVVTDGEGKIYANGTPTPVKKGDIYLSLPCDTHKIETDPEKTLKFDFFAFITEGGCFDASFEQIAENYSSPHARVIHDERIRPLISNAIAELGEENAYKDQILTALFRQILIYTARGFQNIKPAGFGDVSRAETICYKLMNYIDTHIYSMKNLGELSQVTGYSYGYLSALFRDTTANTLANYFQEKKLDTARLLLLEKKLTATEIAELLNYSSVYAFSKAFRKHYGVSPKLYIREKQ